MIDSEANSEKIKKAQFLLDQLGSYSPNNVSIPDHEETLKTPSP